VGSNSESFDLRAPSPPSKTITTTSLSTARRRSGLLTLNALTAAKSLLVPIQCEYYASKA
jgi:cellulose biosynthesis protein BcsQ